MSEHPLRLSHLRRRQRRPTPTFLATLFRSRKTGDGGLVEHVSFELRDGAEHGVQHATRGGPSTMS